MYYMSMEFLMGRSLTNALNNLAVVNQYTEALREMGCAHPAHSPPLPLSAGLTRGFAAQALPCTCVVRVCNLFPSLLLAHPPSCICSHAVGLTSPTPRPTS